MKFIYMYFKLLLYSVEWINNENISISEISYGLCHS